MLRVKLPECPLRLPLEFQYHLERSRQFDLLEHSLKKIVGAALTMHGATNGTAKPGEAPVCDPARMAQTMALVLRDRHFSRQKMQLLLGQVWVARGAERFLAGPCTEPDILCIKYFNLSCFRLDIRLCSA